MEEDDIINNDFLINPREGVGLSGIATSAEPLLQQGSQLSDIQEVEPGAFVDRTSVTSVNDLFNYYYGGMPSQQPVTETPAVEAGAVTTPVVDTGVQDQATGDLGLDTTFQDAGATDVPGTIGTLGSLTEPTTQIAPTVNPLDEFGTAGDVYADVPPTTVNVPALDLSGTSEELIDQGVIETPQEFYGRTYNTSPSEYNLLDQEEKNLVNQQYGTAYNLNPVPETVPDINLLEVAANILGGQITNIPLLGTTASNILGGDQTAPSPTPVGAQFGEEGFADPGERYPRGGFGEEAPVGLSGVGEPDISRLARNEAAEEHYSLLTKRLVNVIWDRLFRFLGRSDEIKKCIRKNIMMGKVIKANMLIRRKFIGEICKMA